jgi:hypothetical protein
MLKVVAVPVEGVNVMPMGTILKLTRPNVAGGVSEIMTKLTLAVPPPPPVPLGRPLQEPRKTHVTRIRKGKAL